MVKDNFYSIQALRAIAAVLVMCFHFKSYINQSFPGVGDRLFKGGEIGVDLFFLISGFIIYYITRDDNKGAESAKIFFIKRFCRVFPPYFVITLFVAGNTIESWTETLKSLLFIPLYVYDKAPWFGVAKLFVGWTLNYEFLFYTLFALCMLFKQKKVIILTVLIIAVVSVPAYFNGMGISASNNYHYPGYLAILTNSLMFEFLIGCFTAWLVINNKIVYSKTISYLLITASAVLFMITILMHSSAIGGLGYILASFVLLFSLTNHEIQYDLNVPLPVLATGKISFSLYLVHYRAKSVLGKVLNHTQHSTYTGVIMFILSVILSFVFAAFSYYLLEKKLSTRLKKFLLSKV